MSQNLRNNLKLDMKREAAYSKCILTWFFHFTLNCIIIIAVRRAVWWLSIHEVLRCSSWSFKSPIRHLQISSRDIRDLSSASAVYWDDVHQQTCGKKKNDNRRMSTWYPSSHSSVCTSSIPFLASSPRVLVPPTWVASGGGEEETRGERIQNNGRFMISVRWA